MQMIPMITKEKLVQTIRTNKALFRETIEAIIYYLELPTPSLNPMKIDEERMRECFEQVFTKDIYLKSHFKTIVDQYNSTIEDHQVLQPLPSEMPIWFLKDECNINKEKAWKNIISKFGTPKREELPSVEELGKEIADIHVPFGDERKLSRLIAKHIIDTYSLNPPKREWWMDLKYGEWYKDHGNHKSVFDHVALISTNGGISNIQNCTPYYEPSIHDKVKEKLGTELYEEFMKEVKNG